MPLGSSAAESGEEPGDSFRFERILNYLEMNYAREISIAELGKRFFLSNSKLYRTFVQHTGRSPLRCLADIRVAHARNMLLNTNLSVAAVAAACGFYDGNHFARVFRSRSGQTPSVYRRSKGAERNENE